MVSPMADRVACSRVMGGWRRWLPNWNTTTSISSKISTEEAGQNGQKTSEMHYIVFLIHHFLKNLKKRWLLLFFHKFTVTPTG